MNIRSIIRGLIYVVALVPLVIFSQYISPFHFGKVVIFRSIVDIMAVCYVILVLRDRSYLPQPSKLLWAVLGFAGAFTIAALFSVNQLQSFWGTLERMGGLWSFWHYVVFYIIASAVLRDRAEWQRLLKFTVVVGVLSAFYGFFQRTDISFFIGSGGRERIFGTIGNPALFAGYQILNVFLAIVLALWAGNTSARKWYLGAAGIMTLAVFLTAVRGSILGIIIGFLVFGLLYALKVSSPLLKRRVFIAMAIVIALGVLGVSLRNTSLIKNSRYFNRVTDLSVSSFTVQTRFWAWQAGIEGWKESAKTVTVGWGPETFNIPFSEHFNPKFFGKSETAFDRAHNMFIEILVTMGVLGLAAYLLFFVVLFTVLNRLKHKPEYYLTASALIGMVVAYLIHNSFIFDTSANFIVFFTALGLITVLSSEYKPSVGTPLIKGGARAAVGAVLAIGAVVLIYQSNIKPAIANYATTRGIVYATDGDLPSAVAHFDKALSYNAAGSYEFRNQYVQSLFAYSEAHQNDPAVIAAIKDAIAAEEKNAAQSPHDYFPELYMARLNIILGKSDPKSVYNDEALKHAQKALEYAPTFVRTYFEIGQAYLNKKDYSHALETFQKAIDLNPEAGQSWWYLAIATVQSGAIPHGIELIDQAIAHGYSPSEEEYKNLSALYASLKDYQHFAMAYEGLTRIAPDNGQYHATLAAAYVKIGRIDDAVAQAHLAAQVDPSFQHDAQLFVQSLGRQW